MHDDDARPTSHPDDAAEPRWVEGPQDLEPERAVVRHLIASHLERLDAEVRPSHRLKANLGLGAVALAVIALDIEDVTGVFLPFAQLAELRTVEDLAALLHQRRREDAGSRVQPMREAPPSRRRRFEVHRLAS